MDLRMVKTQNSIREAFFALRRRKDLEKIQVNELCELAMINKSTFYRHYPDVFSLSETLERELMGKIVSSFSSANTLFTAPDCFVHGLMNALQPHSDEILLLFQGRIHVFANLMEEWLATVYLTEHSSENDKITISFLAGGAIHTFLSPNFRQEDTTETIIQLISKISMT